MKNRIRELRKSKNMSLEKLSKKLKSDQDFNISSDALAKYERQVREPKLKGWKALADFFNVSIGYIQGTSNIDDKKIVDDIDTFYESIPKYVNSNDEFLKELRNVGKEMVVKQYFLMFNTFLKNNPDNNEYEKTKYTKIYEKMASDGLPNINGLFFSTNNLFQIMLDAYDGDKKAIDVDKKIQKIIEDYLELDKNT